MNSHSSNNRDGGFLSDLFTESGTPVRLCWQVLQALLILVSCISMLLEIYEPYRIGFSSFIVTLELTAIGFLTIDYLGSLYFAPDRLAYALGFWGLVDLLSVLPFFLLMLNPSSAIVIKALRTLRFLRLVRLWRIARGGF
ncbi:MAG: ion transporter [Verrucomicrobiota bacterium]